MVNANYKSSRRYRVRSAWRCGLGWSNALPGTRSGGALNGNSIRNGRSRVLSCSTTGFSPLPAGLHAHWKRPRAVRIPSRDSGVQGPARCTEPQPRAGQIRPFHAVHPGVSACSLLRKPECRKGQPLIGMAGPLVRLRSTSHAVPHLSSLLKAPPSRSPRSVARNRSARGAGDRARASSSPMCCAPSGNRGPRGPRPRADRRRRR